MGLSANQIGAILGEISEVLKGGGLRRIDQPQPWSILFEIERNRKRYWLYFSTHRKGPRCHLLSKKLPNPPKPPQFCQLLRARLRYKRLISITQINEDRVIELRCAWPEEASSKVLRFIVELTGFSSNFFLVDDEDRIIAALLPSRSQRKLIVGEKYTFPPRISQKESFEEMPFPLVQTEAFPLNHSVERYFSEREDEEAEQAESKAQRAQLEAAIKRAKKQVTGLKSKYLEAEKTARFKIWGEALKCHLHKIKAGDTFFEFSDPADASPEAIIIPLESALSPPGNMALLFKKYKKGLLAEAALRQMIEKKEAQLVAFEASLNTVLSGEVLKENTLPLLPQKKGAPEEKKAKAGPAVFLSADGIRIIVGRNARENEALTFRLARGNDLWFHARGTSGAHLLVRMEKRKEIPYQTLLDAAVLTKHFSKSRREAKAEILYTYKKYVQRPKNAKPGSVICTQEKTLYVDSDPNRLERLFQSRLG